MIVFAELRLNQLGYMCNNSTNNLPCYYLLTNQEDVGKLPLLPVTELEKRITGLEPVSPAWQAEILPLNYIRKCGRRDLNPQEQVSKTCASASCATPTKI